MKTKYKLLLPVFFALLCMLPKGQVKTDDKIYYNLFDKAEKLFTGEAGEYNDTLALKYFSEVIQHVSNSPEHALLLYNCHERSGILQQGLGYTSKEILQQFYISLSLYKTYHLKDSILFRLLLSAGNTHYTDGLFDSSVYYYSWADKVIQQYPQAGLAGDLYNSLGALYSESGDYKQSGNYFSKALEITKKTKPELKEAMFAMSVNIASALRLSGQLDSAIHLYKKLLHPDAPSAPLLNNIGRIYLAKKIPDSALYYLQQVKDTTGVYSIPYNNSLALAYMQKEDTVMAKKYLDAATGIFHKNPQQVKSNYYGNTCKYIGDLKVMEKLPAEALTYYQQAIMQLNFKFNDENIFSNPTNFIGDFASYDLFEALLAKAGCFALLYEGDHQKENFIAAKRTYETSFALADYIKKSIDNDEARLFIADKVFGGYKKAVDFIMQEYQRTSDQDLTILALKWISKSRATSLAISLKENSIKQFAGLPDSLLQKEKNIKINISRLKLQLKQVADSSTQNEILSGINNAEFQLNQVTNTYRRFPDYYRQKFASDSVDITSIQQNILDNNSAIICYFTGEKSIMAFVIKRSAIVYQTLPDDSLLTQQLKSFSESLVETNTGKNNGTTTSKNICNTLIKPLTKYFADVTSLIIIPDQQLIGIPFEALQMQDDKFLVEKYAVTYQYALPFVQLNSKMIDHTNALAFAPFANTNNAAFSILHSSREEISGFDKQAQLVDENATRNNFLQRVSGASVIHLATHAVVNFDDPSNSYIAFYPVNTNDSSYKLFAHELYNLQLSNAQLVFLSACETGTGKVSQSEGALSLSRAFAYAGCANIVTSLWKAEDKSTAYISTKFYYYLDKGYTYAEALQQAKKDLLADASMSQFHAPQYWSHLIFIGDVQRSKSSNILWIILGGVLIVITVLYFIKRK